MHIVTRKLSRLAAASIVVLLAEGTVACGPRAAPSPDPVKKPAPAVTAPAFEKLVGRWERTDGGYILEVRAIDADGKAQAAYLNPRPIHVEQALATRAGGTLTLFVELQDVNYPGSTYNLAFDPASDRLEGTYFQAVEGQTYSVTFERR
jgi:hypothetical protein